MSLDAALALADQVLVGGRDGRPPSVSPADPGQADTTRPCRAPTAVGLTPRELEVLGQLAEGKRNAEIADALFIGTGTVRTHVSNILAKLDARTRTEAAALGRRHGLV